MSAPISRGRFQTMLCEYVTARFATLGYLPKNDEPYTFHLKTEELVKGFICSPDRSLTHFRVQVGVSASALLPKIHAINASGHLALQLSRLLGEFPNCARGVPTCYYFKTPGQLASAIDRLYTDFVREAIPWLDSFEGIESLAKAYYQHWLAGFVRGDERAPPSGVMAVYGWLLQETGRTDEARPWLQRAHDKLLEQIYTKNRRVVPDPTEGAVRAEMSPELKRLSQLIDESLARE